MHGHPVLTKVWWCTEIDLSSLLYAYLTHFPGSFIVTQSYRPRIILINPFQSKVNKSLFSWRQRFALFSCVSCIKKFHLPIKDVSFTNLDTLLYQYVSFKDKHLACSTVWHKLCQNVSFRDKNFQTDCLTYCVRWIVSTLVFQFEMNVYPVQLCNTNVVIFV